MPLILNKLPKNGWSYVLGIKPDCNKSLFNVFDKKIPHLRLKYFSYTEDKIKYEYSYLNNIALYKLMSLCSLKSFPNSKELYD